MKPETRRMLENALLGKKIEIINMHGEPQYGSKTGVVEHIDDNGQLHGTWGGCAIDMSLDQWKIVG